MSTARKMRAPKTDPAIAPTFDPGVAGAVEDALGEELEVEVVPEEGAIVEEGDLSLMQEESPDKPTVLRTLPPGRPWASTKTNMICVPL